MRRLGRRGGFRGSRGGVSRSGGVNREKIEEEGGNDRRSRIKEELDDEGSIDRWRTETRAG